VLRERPEREIQHKKKKDKEAEEEEEPAQQPRRAGVTSRKKMARPTAGTAPAQEVRCCSADVGSEPSLILASIVGACVLFCSFRCSGTGRRCCSFRCSFRCAHGSVAMQLLSLLMMIGRLCQRCKRSARLVPALLRMSPQRVSWAATAAPLVFFHSSPISLAASRLPSGERGVGIQGGRQGVHQIFQGRQLGR
jgi:hypothetical protein